MSGKGIALGAWSGPLGMVAFGTAISPFVGHFLPIPSPSLTPEQSAALYLENGVGVRIAGILMLFAGSLLTFFFATISSQLRRIDDTGAPYAYMQLGIGTLANAGFYMSAVLWCTIPFRAYRTVAEASLMHDLSWIMLVMPGPIVMAQMVPIALAILSDKSPNPLFPRWVGYLNIWVAVTFIPAMLVPFFHSGPFAWNGILAFWIGAIAFFIWACVMCWVLLEAGKRTDPFHE